MARGGRIQEVWGTEVPQRGPGAQSLVGLGAKGAKPPKNGCLVAELDIF